MPNTASRTYTMDDIRTANRMRGLHWFDPDTIRFFRTRLGSVHQGPGGVYFTTSEQGPDGVRRHSVRVFDPATGHVETHGEFQGHATSAQAVAAAKLAARGEVCEECGRPWKRLPAWRDAAHGICNHCANREG